MDPQIQALIDAINKLSGGTTSGGQNQNPVVIQLVSIRTILTAILTRMGGSALNGRGAGGSGRTSGGGGGRFGKLRQRAGQALMNSRFGRTRAGRAVASRISGGGGGMGGAAAAAWPIAAIVGIWTGIYSLLKAGNELGKEQIQESRRLAAVSPSQAAIIAGLDVARLFRDLEKGERTKGTARDLVKSQNDLERQTMPIQAALDNFYNRIATFANEKILNFIGNMQTVAEALPFGIGAAVKDALKPGDPGPPTMAEDINRIFEQEKSKVDEAWKKKDAVRKQQEQDRFRGMPGWAGGR